MERTIEAQFKMMIELYIKQVDYLNITWSFGRYDQYTTEMLEKIFLNKSNQRYIETAKSSFIEYLDIPPSVEDKTIVYINKNEIINYVFDYERNSSYVLTYILPKHAFEKEKKTYFRKYLQKLQAV